MPFKAGFAEVDITPPVGTLKIGWKKIIVSDQILDPLYARVVVFETDNDRLAFIQLDTLSIRWTQVNDIRGRITDHYGPWSVMVSATHNHAGPAVANAGEVPRDETYVETLVTRIVECFGRAVEAMQDAEIARGHGTEWGGSPQPTGCHAWWNGKDAWHIRRSGCALPGGTDRSRDNGSGRAGYEKQPARYAG